MNRISISNVLSILVLLESNTRLHNTFLNTNNNLNFLDNEDI